VSRLAGKVAIVTGAAQGMGAAEASQFVEEGATVYLTDVNDEAGTALADSLGSTAHYVHLDVGDEKSWNDLVETVTETHGGLDVLVNNAGLSRVGMVTDFDWDDFDAMVRVNQRGVLLGMRSVVEPMRARSGGSIINIASAAALKGLAGLSVYSGTKFAVRGMTQSAAAELAADQIRVNVIHPGATDTPMHQANSPDWQAQLLEKVPLRRFGTPVDIAEMATFLASDASAYITGSDFTVDGGFLL
jgi:3alpha(or 20beta)-hydroxysteroid dehydrogenase